MATRSMIYKEEQDGTLKGIYCHWDGYLEYNGSILLEHYSEPDKLEKLLALGDISSLGEELEVSEAVRLYGHYYYISEDFKALSDEEQERLKNEASSGKYTVAYHRDFGEKMNPNDIITLEEQKQGKHLFEKKGVDYIYIQDKNGVWYVNRRDGDKYFNGVLFKKVTQEMVEG